MADADVLKQIEAVVAKDNVKGFVVATFPISQAKTYNEAVAYAKAQVLGGTSQRMAILKVVEVVEAVPTLTPFTGE